MVIRFACLTREFTNKYKKKKMQKKNRRRTVGSDGDRWCERDLNNARRGEAIRNDNNKNVKRFYGVFIYYSFFFFSGVPVHSF